MKAYWITGNLINWFKSYLKARRQKVVIKNNSSIYKFILVEIVINMFVYNSLHYFPNTTYKRYRSVIRRNEESPFLNTAIT
jgi:hypothetical protein